MNLKLFLWSTLAMLTALSTNITAQQAGDGVGGVNTGVRKKPGGQHVGNAVTDDRGNFRFEHLPAGEYAITFTPPKRTANYFQQPHGNPAAMLVMTSYDGKPARMVLAKNYYESRSNTARLTVTNREGKPTDMGFTWDAISGAVTADLANSRAMKLTYPVARDEAGFICVAGGCAVSGQIVYGPPAK